MEDQTLGIPMTDLPSLATTCEESAKFYEAHPGMTQHSGIVPDIYRTVALLARMVADLQKQEAAE